MWVEDTTRCTGCGADVVLATDGREAYVYVSTGVGDTSEVWRDGFLLKAICPGYNLRTNDSCCTELSWTGEGASIDWSAETYAEPILEVAP